MPKPSVTVVAYPKMYATALAGLFRTGGFTVDVPDIMAEEWENVGQSDVVLASLPVTHHPDGVLIQLPNDFEKPVTVWCADVVVRMQLDVHRPMRQLVELVGQLTALPRQDAADLLVTLAGPAHVQYLAGDACLL